MIVKIFFVVFVAGVSARTIRSTSDEAISGGNTFSCPLNWKYLAHYAAKGCRAVYEGDSGWPTRFNCSALEENQSEGCMFRGKHYDVGSPVDTSSPCQNCHCGIIEDAGRTVISCAVTECPEGFGIRQPGCYNVYSERECCAVETKCDAEGEPKCSWNNRTYNLGERIYPEEEDCLVCQCTSDWDGLNYRNCREVDCVLEDKKELLRVGCLPIYHEQTCCPIEFHCPEMQHEDEEPNTPSTVEDPNKCYFGGKAYSRGEVLDYVHPTGCVTCTCCTPPDFTCIHQSTSSCPKPSQDDGECHPIHKNGVCCPEYNCTSSSRD